jgi:hypothetical protein
MSQRTKRRSNNRRKTSSRQRGREAKGEITTSVVGYGLPRSLLDATAVFPYKLVTAGQIFSDAKGVIAGFVSCSPSVTSFTEYGTISALFSEVKLRKASLSLWAVNPHGDGASVLDAAYSEKTILPIAYDDQLVNSVPGSFNTVLDNARCKLFHLGSPVVFNYLQEAKNRLWAPTGTPAPGPYAGCTGQFSFYQSNLTLSVHYADFAIAVEFLFRNRI